MTITSRTVFHTTSSFGESRASNVTTADQIHTSDTDRDGEENEDDDGSDDASRWATGGRCSRAVRRGSCLLRNGSDGGSRSGETEDDRTTVGETEGDVAVCSNRDGISGFTGTEDVLPIVSAAESELTSRCGSEVDCADNVGVFSHGADIEENVVATDVDASADRLVAASEGATTRDVTVCGINQGQVFVDLVGSIPVGNHVATFEGFLCGRDADGNDASGSPAEASDGVETIHLSGTEGLGADINEEPISSDDVGDGGDGFDGSFGAHVEGPDVLETVRGGGADTVSTRGEARAVGDEGDGELRVVGKSDGVGEGREVGVIVVGINGRDPAARSRVVGENETSHRVDGDAVVEVGELNEALTLVALDVDGVTGVRSGVGNLGEVPLGRQERNGPFLGEGGTISRNGVTDELFLGHVRADGEEDHTILVRDNQGLFPGSECHVTGDDPFVVGEGESENPTVTATSGEGGSVALVVETHGDGFVSASVHVEFEKDVVIDGGADGVDGLVREDNSFASRISSNRCGVLLLLFIVNGCANASIDSTK